MPIARAVLSRRAFGAAGILPHARQRVKKKDHEEIQGVAYSNLAVSFFLCAGATWVILSPCSTVERVCKRKPLRPELKKMLTPVRCRGKMLSHLTGTDPRGERTDG